MHRPPLIAGFSERSCPRQLSILPVARYQSDGALLYELALDTDYSEPNGPVTKVLKYSIVVVAASLCVEGKKSSIRFLSAMTIAYFDNPIVQAITQLVYKSMAAAEWAQKLNEQSLKTATPGKGALAVSSLNDILSKVELLSSAETVNGADDHQMHGRAGRCHRIHGLPIL